MARLEAGSPELKLYDAYFALLDGRLEAVERALAQAVQVCLYPWQMLPRIHTGAVAHQPLLHDFHRLIELRESAVVLSDVPNIALVAAFFMTDQKMNRCMIQTMPDGMLKSTRRLWQERLPNKWDGLRRWEDVLCWRNEVFRVITATYSYGDPADLAGLHDTPWTLLKLAHRRGRRRGLRGNGGRWGGWGDGRVGRVPADARAGAAVGRLQSKPQRGTPGDQQLRPRVPAAGAARGAFPSQGLLAGRRRPPGRAASRDCRGQRRLLARRADPRHPRQGLVLVGQTYFVRCPRGGLLPAGGAARLQVGAAHDWTRPAHAAVRHAAAAVTSDLPRPRPAATVGAGAAAAAGAGAGTAAGGTWGAAAGMDMDPVDRAAHGRAAAARGAAYRAAPCQARAALPAVSVLHAALPAAEAPRADSRRAADGPQERPAAIRQLPRGARQHAAGNGAAAAGRRDHRATTTAAPAAERGAADALGGGDGGTERGTSAAGARPRALPGRDRVADADGAGRRAAVVPPRVSHVPAAAHRLANASHGRHGGCRPGAGYVEPLLHGRGLEAAKLPHLHTGLQGRLLPGRPDHPAGGSSDEGRCGRGGGWDTGDGGGGGGGEDGGDGATGRRADGGAGDLPPEEVEAHHAGADPPAAVIGTAARVLAAAGGGARRVGDVGL
ncbi:unnamed protein product [Phaeothamnion confervicola]